MMILLKKTGWYWLFEENFLPSILVFHNPPQQNLQLDSPIDSVSQWITLLLLTWSRVDPSKHLSAQSQQQKQ